eukprot:6979849-Prymnesium_polylepis.1
MAAIDAMLAAAKAAAAARPLRVGDGAKRKGHRTQIERCAHTLQPTLFTRRVRQARVDLVDDLARQICEADDGCSILLCHIAKAAPTASRGAAARALHQVNLGQEVGQEA